MAKKQASKKGTKRQVKSRQKQEERNNSKLMLALLLVIAVAGVGYAAIQTTLTIIGSASIAANSENFEQNIIFASAMVVASDGSTQTATIAPDGKSVSFTTQTLKAVGDNAVLKYTVKNDSNYHATISSLACTTDPAIGTDYLTFTIPNTFNVDKGQVSLTQETTIAMKKTYAEATALPITVTCQLTAVASDAE